MADNSAIEWCDASWNPIRSYGPNRWLCQKVSQGCDNCYASRLNVRFGGAPYPEPGSLLPGHTFSDTKTLAQPLHWKRPRRIFVCSMSDLFGDWVSDNEINHVMEIIERCPQHTFIVLTKRATRMEKYFADYTTDGPWPIPNLWLGVSVETQDYAWRLNHLLAIPAAVHFASIEPLLGAVDLNRWLYPAEQLVCPHCLNQHLDFGSWRSTPHHKHLCLACERTFDSDVRSYGANEARAALDWVIVGGESGRVPEHRYLTSAARLIGGVVDYDADYSNQKADAVRQLRDQCTAAGVAFFFKQWGGPTPKSGGRLLDDREWSEYPSTESKPVDALVDSLVPA